MTDRPAPTDAELDALCIEISDYDDAAYFRHMARTVLARFGTPPPAVAREPLTDAQIDAITADNNLDSIHSIVRHVERHHDITKE